MSVIISGNKITPNPLYKSKLFLFPESSLVCEEIKSKISTKDSIKVRMICNWCSDQDLYKLWKKMIPSSRFQGLNLQFVEGEDEVDYLIIVNKPQHTSKIDDIKIKGCKTLIEKYKKTIVFTMEPDYEYEHREQWNSWYLQSDKKHFLRFFNHSTAFNNNEWHMSLTYDRLYGDFNRIVKSEAFGNEVLKTQGNKMSSIVSSLYSMIGHKKRVDFLKYIESTVLSSTPLISSISSLSNSVNLETIELDIYGFDNNHSFKNYRGPLPSHCKEDGILPYKYTFIAENCQLKNYYTEKLSDCIMGETLCFYWGCPNISDFIDINALIILDLNDFEGSKKIIIDAIKNNEWEKRLPSILKEKRKMLQHYSFYKRVEGVIQLDLELEIVADSQKHLIENGYQCGKELCADYLGKFFSEYELEKKVIESAKPYKLLVNLPSEKKLVFTEHFMDKLSIGFRLMKERGFEQLILGMNDENDLIAKQSEAKLLINPIETEIEITSDPGEKWLMKICSQSPVSSTTSPKYGRFRHHLVCV